MSERMKILEGLFLKPKTLYTFQKFLFKEVLQNMNKIFFSTTGQKMKQAKNGPENRFFVIFSNLGH